jgi:hypothetical protein
MTRRFLWAFVLMAGSQCGCDSVEQPKIASETGKVSKPAALVPKTRNANSYSEATYRITKDEDDSNNYSRRRTVQIELSKKVSTDVLRKFAIEVKSSEAIKNGRTLIFCYLPEQVEGVPKPWATAHFNPTLDVRITGLTEDDEISLRKLPREHPGKEVGTWLIETQFTSNISLIYEVEGKLKLAEFLVGRGRFDTNLIELPAVFQQQRRFKKVNGDDIYEIDQFNILRMYDGFEKTLFAAAQPLR